MPRKGLAPSSRRESLCGKGDKRKLRRSVASCGVRAGVKCVASCNTTVRDRKTSPLLRLRLLLYYGAKEIPTGTCNAILKAAGLK